jgi:hypothetical protein
LWGPYRILATAAAASDCDLTLPRLDATLERTDGMPAYLENSNLKNTRLYERAGFVAQKNIPPERAPPLIPMWRTDR